jgi:tetratricopeptide (TPR) repeat protein
MRFGSLMWLCCTAVVVVIATSPAMAMTISKSVASSAKLAIELSTKANINPSFADEACELWQSILCVDDTDEIPLPLSAMSVAHGLFGMTLSRVGRDREALVQFDSSIAFFDKCKTNEAVQLQTITKAEADVLLAKSKSLQRLMKYRDAITVLNNLSSRCKATNAQSKEGNALRICREESVERAALCSMRMGDVNLAIRLFEDLSETSSSGYYEAGVEGMLGACLLLEELITGSNKDRHEKAQQLLQNASQSSALPIYNWIYHHLVACEENFNPFDEFSKDDIYALFAEANNSPFDDPDLIFLDDKIRFHELMKDYNTLCPVGYVLPREMDVLESDWNDDEQRDSVAWMLKDRAGYGSHGNMVARLEDVLNLVLDEEKLCQRIVHPPLILSNGCKFSLRVYVVYFPADPDQVFISKEGLVKFASSLYSNGANNNVDDQYMTNSGRGDGRSSKQAEFDFLRQEFNEKEDVDFDAMWQKIKNSVELVMNRYSTLKRQDIDGKFFSRGYISHFGLPKILGFDFILDGFSNPWLLEVNRFPGLDPRGTSDARVKHSVQYDAWITATRRVGQSPEHMKKFRPNDYKGFSLEQLCNK